MMTLFNYFSDMGINLTSTELHDVKKIVCAETERENVALNKEVDRLRKLGMRATKKKR